MSNEASTYRKDLFFAETGAWCENIRGERMIKGWRTTIMHPLAWLGYALQVWRFTRRNRVLVERTWYYHFALKYFRR